MYILNKETLLAPHVVVSITVVTLAMDVTSQCVNPCQVN